MNIHSSSQNANALVRSFTLSSNIKALYIWLALYIYNNKAQFKHFCGVSELFFFKHNIKY